MISFDGYVEANFTEIKSSILSKMFWIFCYLFLAFPGGVESMVPYPGDIAPLEELVRYYFSMSLPREAILGFLLFVHHISISHRTLGRILQRLGLRRRMNESQPGVIIRSILSLHNQGYRNIGYKSMWKLLHLKYNINVTQETVRRALIEIDPEGVLLRSQHRLRRRIYSNQGPNCILHMDGYDKLTLFGFPIHGGIDGFSRKILWLNVIPSSKNPKYVGRLFMNYIQSSNILPRILRCDAGTENTVAKRLQMFLRSRHTDRFSRIRSVSIGRSTANQRIEMLWGILMRYFTTYWKNLFKDLIDIGLFNNTNPIHVQTLRFCFYGLLQDNLDTFRTAWNYHRICSQPNRDISTGIPEVLYSQSRLYGARNCGLALPLSQREIRVICEETTEPIPFRCCDFEYQNILELLTGKIATEIPVPQTAYQALLLYEAIVSRIG